MNLSLCAQVRYEQIKSFGIAELSGSDANGPLCLGSDHNLYGTTYSGGSRDRGTVFRMQQDGSNYTVLRSFEDGEDGKYPDGGLVEASNGLLYGTTRYGGELANGIIFKLARDGSGYESIQSLGAPNDGARPIGTLVEGLDGALYGMAEGGGAAGSGTIFRVALAGHFLTIIHTFAGGFVDGRLPSGSLVLGSDGMLYGTTRYGGSHDSGIVFKLAIDGSGYSILRHFSWADGGGRFPNGVIESTNGFLYGTTSYGGTFGYGSVFQMGKSGSGSIDLFHFLPVGPRRPWATLLEGADGNLYGTTYEGGTNGLGTVFRIAKDGNDMMTIHDFSGGDADGRATFDVLGKGDGGNIYGSAAGGRAGAGVVFRLSPGDAPEYSIIKHLSNSGGDASGPGGGVIEGHDGFLYGATVRGGESDAGTLLRLRSDGRDYQILHQFHKRLGGEYSPSHLIKATDGLLYGTATSGGISNAGALFRIGKDGDAYSVIHRFLDADGDGTVPTGLMEGTDGRLFGTTRRGGQFGDGTVFALSRDGRDYRILWSFDESAGYGYQPRKGVIECSDGWLYGTTSSGGTNFGGTVFKMRNDGTGFAVVWHFPDGVSEFEGASQLIEASDGALYGTNPEGPSYEGEIFKLNKDGTGYTVLHDFGTDTSKGRWPFSGVIEGRDGALYGTTRYDTTVSWGTLFKIEKNGTGLRLLHVFPRAAPNGYAPTGRLLEGRDGRLYGTTAIGGSSFVGTVYRLTTLDLSRLNIEPIPGGHLLQWNSVPGVRYRVQHKSDFVQGTWADLTDDLIAEDTGATYSDTAGAGQRVYRLQIFTAP